jgi:hypothetical protein
MRKSMTTLAILGLLALTIPAFADYSGPWNGHATGTMPSPLGDLQPFKDWFGNISADHSTFQGYWKGILTHPDGTLESTTGTFYATLTSFSPYMATYEGFWYWDKYPGDKWGFFKMTFYWKEWMGECHGEWHSMNPAGFWGYMTGKNG